MTIRPPLNALHTFCMVVSHGGFRQAAQALHVTPGAVSKQIQLLEAYLKEVLFDRLAGSLATPTPAGARLYARVANEMTVISEALDGKNATARHATVIVDTSVTLAMHWLIPLLRRFNERYPDIQVQVRTTDGPINPAAPVDIFIRREEAELRGLPQHTFMVERSVLVGAPAFMASLTSHEARGEGWIHSVPRIGMRSRTDLWPKWQAAQGIAGRLEPTMEYDNTVLSIQAALQGLGVLVVPEVFVSAMLEARTLVSLVPERIKSGTYSYAVGRQQDSVRTTAFTDWLMDCGRQSD
ncbi:LysR substrate-binding domain-containing protein [Rugamonas apoptosis]|uniref:LysR family transcriptional regulator n=1 Tax=Rugamonas apoptosis TaxID=2758570 RepID=A0A7W2IK84_9BURK|nr:LysR family transcriptional regulator [Rugamonas apoptosis]MBA5687137.1 LysR family transcriptional regulator [Rugamonas apoptosis]